MRGQKSKKTLTFVYKELGFLTKKERKKLNNVSGKVVAN